MKLEYICLLMQNRHYNLKKIFDLKSKMHYDLLEIFLIEPSSNENFEEKIWTLF